MEIVMSEGVEWGDGFNRFRRVSTPECMWIIFDDLVIAPEPDEDEAQNRATWRRSLPTSTWYDRIPTNDGLVANLPILAADFVPVLVRIGVDLRAIQVQVGDIFQRIGLKTSGGFGEIHLLPGNGLRYIGLVELPDPLNRTLLFIPVTRGASDPGLPTRFPMSFVGFHQIGPDKLCYITPACAGRMVRAEHLELWETWN